MNNNIDEINYSNFLTLVDSHIESIEDIKNQYLKLMSELTVCETMTNNEFYKKIQQISLIGTIIVAYKHRYVNYIDENTNVAPIAPIELIGSGSIIIEPKIIRGCKSVGHIEDIVIKSNHRGKKISHIILDKLKEIGKKSNCYKIILDCDEKVSHVYKSNGFDLKGVQMTIYF